MKRSVVLALLLATACNRHSTATAPAGNLAGVDQTLIAKAVKPGDDFNGYANGVWTAKTRIPADRSSTGVGYEVFKVAEDGNAGLIKGSAGAHAAAGTPEARIA